MKPPHGMIVRMQKIMPILASVFMLGFFTLCVGINLGGTPRGLRHPRGAPSVDPSTLGGKTLYELASLKYCYIAIFPPSRHFKLAGSEQYVRYQRFAAEEFVLRSGGVLCPQPGCGMGIMPESAVTTEAGASNPGNRRIACAGPQGCGYVFCRDCLQVSY